MGDRAWMKGADADVRVHLERTLARVRGARPHVVLGVARSEGGDAVRAAFLDATKSFHPTRYARRSVEVQKLANELFLTIKAAYDELSRAAGANRAETVPAGMPEVAPASTAPAPSPQASAPAASAARAASDPRFREAAVLIDRKEYGPARAKLAGLLSEFPGDVAVRAHYHYAAGGEYLAMGRNRLALSELKRALIADPTFEPARRAAAKLAAGQLGGLNGK